MLHRPLPCENLMARAVAAMARRTEPSSRVDVAAAARPSVMASPQKLRRVMGVPAWTCACGHAMVSATLRIVFPLRPIISYAARYLRILQLSRPIPVQCISLLQGTYQ